MAGFLKIVVVGIVGVVIGLIASAFAISNPSPFDRVQLGAWSVEAHSGSIEADPYTRARIAHSGEIPLASGEGLQMMAREDDDGRPLNSRCVYQIGPGVPASRYWSLSLVDPRGVAVANPAERYGFRSSEILRFGDGSFVITAAADVQPGNWLPIGAPGPFALLLTVYDLPLGATVAAIDPATVPRVTRSGCS